MPSAEHDFVAQAMFQVRAEEVGTPSLDEVRLSYSQTFRQFQVMAPIPPSTEIDSVYAGGVPALLVKAEGVSTERAIFYLHGGGYAYCSAHLFSEFAFRLSAATGAQVFLLDYRLAPEHPYPAALEDSLSAYNWLLDTGLDPTAIVIGGDSAGGGLTVATLMALRDDGGKLPAAAFTLSPWVDLALTSESFANKAEEDPILTPEELETVRDYYLAGKDPLSLPLASPLYGSLGALPPLSIHVGTAELLLDDSRNLAEKASAAGTDVTLTVGEGLMHDWPLFPILPEAATTLSEIGSFVRDKTTTWPALH